MKISKLHIDKFRHLENLEFDFTYPKDFHIEEKRGKPLDKICFIGQSATGKTRILDTIYFLHDFFENFTFSENGFIHNIDSSITPEMGIISIEINGIQIKFNEGEVIINNKLFKHKNGNTFGGLNILNKIIYFKSDLINKKNLEAFCINPIQIIEKHTGIDNNKRMEHLLNQITLFDDEIDESTWVILLSEILNYKKRYNQKISELIHQGLLNDTKKLQSEYEKWQKTNPNVLELFANKFNPILEKLNLEVDAINTEFTIPIKNKKTDEIIPIQNTSTGTKGLLLSYLPLYKLDTKDSIILIDEPERSLYPDMQMDLMEHYQNLAPEAQFIIATHSPFVAASFEPEERFILYFDEEGKVKVRNGKSPIGDDPNDMLKNDFGINYYNKFGEDAYKKYLKLKEDLSNETNPQKKKELLLETVKLGDTYNF